MKAFRRKNWGLAAGMAASLGTLISARALMADQPLIPYEATVSPPGEATVGYVDPFAMETLPRPTPPAASASPAPKKAKAKGKFWSSRTRDAVTPATHAQAAVAPSPTVLALPAGYVGEGTTIPTAVQGHGHAGVGVQVYGHFKDRMCGYGEYFAQPPLGFIRDEVISMQAAKADGHKFTLYRSDFIPGTTKLSPSGAARMNVMATRLSGWLGPIVVEWTPEDPALGEARKGQILAQLQGAGLPVVPERVLVGPTATPGLNGVQADVNYQSMQRRYSQAPAAFAVPPNFSSGVDQVSGGGGS